MTARVVAVALVIAVLAGCGGGDNAVEAKQAKVPLGIVPASLASGTLTIAEDDDAHKAFGKLGERALVADGRLWTIRQGKRLVGTLQVSTVKSKVDLLDEEERESIVSLIVPSSTQRFTLRGIPIVQTGSSEDKTVYVWFGESLFQVLQVKGSKIDPERLLTELVEFQVGAPGWKSLPDPDDGD